jgi:hypothetical protein
VFGVAILLALLARADEFERVNALFAAVHESAFGT